MHSSPTVGLSFNRSTGRVSPGARSTVVYPNPFFDLAHTYLPSTVKELFRLCTYFFLTNPLIHTVVSKMAEYPITDPLFETNNLGVQKQYERLFFDVLGIRDKQVEIGLDYFCYGNSFITIQYPMKKYLVCSNCGVSKRIEDVKYRFGGFKYRLECAECGHSGNAKVKDVYLRSLEGVKLVRWNPEYVDIDYNHATGECEYTYTLPQRLKNDITRGKRLIVERTPHIFIEAVSKRKALVLNKENLFHFRRPTVAQQDSGWGMPLILPSLKDVFYLQVLKKAQECISPETLIETDSGLIRADDVAVGTFVRTHTGKFLKVEGKWYRDVKEGEVAKEITLSALRPLPSVYSPNHPILSLRRNESTRRKDSKDKQRSSIILKRPHLFEEVLCPAKDVEGGDYLLYPAKLPAKELMVDVSRYTGFAATETYVYSGCSPATAESFETLERGDWVEHDSAGRVAKRVLRDERVPKRFPSRILMTPELAYIVGWYVGDGAASARHLTICTHKNDPLDLLAEAVKETFGLDCTYENRGEVRATIISDVIVTKLMKGLVPGTAREKRAPQEVLCGTDPVKLAFLKGLIEADGYIDDKRVILTTSSRDLAYDVYRMTLHLGCIANVISKKRSTTEIDGRLIKAGASYQVTLSTASRDRLLALWAGEEAPIIASGKSGFFWKDYFAARVLSVEDVQEEIFIDFKVEEDTTFCTPGIATKNSIAMEHIVPMRVLFPQPGTVSTDPYTQIDLGKWVQRVQREIEIWRGDYNYMPVFPLPIGNQNIGGDGRALLLAQEIRAWSEGIVAGMGVPNEFVYGGLSYSGTSVSIRMLENQFINYRRDQLRFLRFVRDRLGPWLRLPDVIIKQKPFKMADDLNRMQYAFQLNQGTKISDETLLKLADFDPEKEMERKDNEIDRQLNDMRKQQLTQAEIQAEAMLIQSKYQQLAQQMQQQEASSEGAPSENASVAQQPAPNVSSPGAPSGGPNAQQGQGNLEEIAKHIATQIMAIEDEGQRAMIMQQLQAQRPDIFELVNRLLQAGRVTPGRPLPEQRPARREGGKPEAG